MRAGLRRQQTKTLKQQATIGSVSNEFNQFETNIFAQQAAMAMSQLPPDREEPRANLYNVVKRLRENNNAYNHIVLVAELISDVSNKTKKEDLMRNFFHGLQKDIENEFHHKVTGYCCIFEPHYICFLESEDSEFLDYVLQEIRDTIGQSIHKQVWTLFATEEVPERAFDQFEVRSFPAAQSQFEIISMPQLEKTYKIYDNMLEIGKAVREKANGPKANEPFDYQSHSINSLPAQQDLQSAIQSDAMTLEEHLNFFNPPDILLEDELCWPVKPDLDY